MEHPIHVGVLKRVLAQNSSAELTEKYADTGRNTQVRKTLDSLDSDICICNVAGNTRKKQKKKTNVDK